MRVTLGKYPGLRSKKERVVKVRIDDYDVWNLDHTLALIIYPALVRLKEKKHGAPLVEDELVPDELKSTAAPPKENEWDTDENHFKRWDWVMDQMIFSFRELVEDTWEEQFHSGEMDIEWKKTDESGELLEMSTGPKHTHRFDAEGYRAHLARIQLGLDLFGRFFLALWD